MGLLASPGLVPFLTTVSIPSALLTTTMKANGLAYTATVFNVIAAKFSTSNDTGGSRPYYCTVILYLLCMNEPFLFSPLNNLVMPAISMVQKKSLPSRHTGHLARSISLRLSTYMSLVFIPGQPKLLLNGGIGRDCSRLQGATST